VRVVLGIVAGVVLLACAIVALAPAGLLDPLVASRTEGRVRLADANGFWWRGDGVVTATGTQASVPVAWRIRLLQLLRGRLTIEFVPAHTGMPTGTLAVARGEVEAHALQFTLPAALLPAFVPALSTVTPDGDLDVTSASFTWRAAHADGRVDVVWRDAELALVGFPISLGTIRGAASGTPEGLQGTFENRGGELGARGTWAMRGDAIDGVTTLTPTIATSPALRAVLPMLGTRDAGGNVRIEWRSRR
jgi:hypothetical protein